MRLGPSQWIVGIGLVTIVALFWILRIWLSGSEVGLLTSDVFLYYLPTYETLYGTLLDGRLPLWNPYQLCGIPRLASLQAGFFYPGHLLYLVLPVKLAFGLSGVLHLGLIATSTAVLVRRLGLGVGAGVVASLLVAIRGRYPGMVFFPNMLEAAAWLPVGAVAVLAIVRGGRLRSAAFLGACTGMSLLAGYPQVSVYAVYGWGALLFAFLVMERKDAGSWARCSGLFGLAIGLGLAIAAVQLLPGWELTAEGTRAPGPLTRWQQFPFGWFGPGVLEALVETLHAPFPLLTLSFGWVALACLVAGLFERSHRVLAIACTSVAGLVLLFAMGPVTPLFDWIAMLPALGWFRFPRRSLFLLDFLLALVAAVGVYGGIRLAGSRLRAGAPTASVWLSAVPIALVALEIFAAEPNREALFAAGSMEVYSREREIFARVRDSGERVWLRSPGIQSKLLPKLATYFEMRSVGDYEPLNLRRQADYFTYLMEGRLQPARGGRPYSGRLKHLTAPTYPGAISQRGHLLDVAAVHWLVVSRAGARQGELARTIEARGWSPEASVSDPEFVLLRNPHAVPRAFVVHDVREAPEPAALLSAMSEPSFDPLASSYAEGYAESDAQSQAEGVTPLAGPKPYGSPARITVDEDTLVEVEAELPEPGMLVLADSFYPGWVATVDGAAREILPANHLFRGVLLPAGSHRVRFAYEPWTVPVGAAVSACALVAIALVARLRPQ